MSGFCLDNLEKASSKKDKANEQTITLKDLSNESLLTCDFYISDQSHSIKPRTDPPFYASQVFHYSDSDTKTSLHLHFYKTTKPEFYIVVPKKGLWIQIRRYFTYFWWRYIRPPK